MPHTQGKVRNCLKCDRSFFSEHFGHRLCRTCGRVQTVLVVRGRCSQPEKTPKVQTCLDQ